MSPEQVQGLPTVDGRADQFSLAVIAFEMLTGEKPFTGEHLTTVVYKIVAGDPIPPRRLNPTLGPEIEAVLRKGLAKQPDDRYLSCLEFVNALDKACAATKGWTNLARGGSQEMPTVADQPLRHPLPGRRWRRLRQTGSPRATPPCGDRERHRVSALTVILAVLVAAGLVGLIAWQAAPWLIDSGKHETKQTTPEQSAQAQPPQAQPPPEAKPSPVKTPDTPPPTPPESKPPESTTPAILRPRNQAGSGRARARTAEIGRAAAPKAGEAEAGRPAQYARHRPAAGRRRRHQPSRRPGVPGRPLRHLLPHALHHDGAARPALHRRSRSPAIRPSTGRSTSSTARRTCRPS